MKRWTNDSDDDLYCVPFRKTKRLNKANYHRLKDKRNKEKRYEKVDRIH